jgi:hypothetical protein
MHTWNAVLSIIFFAALPVSAIYMIALFIMRGNRKRSVSPLSEGLLRGPGHSLRLRFEDLFIDVMGLAMIIVFTSVIFGREVAQADGKFFLIFLAFFIGVIIVFTVQLFRKLSLARNIKLGMEAEMACGQELSLLMRDGWHVFHDIPADKNGTKFNIDHILIGAPGVYVVETKGRRKPLTKDGKKQYEALYRDGYIEFPDGRDSKAIEQAHNNAKYASEWLSKACGFKVEAIPALLFPGWFFDRATTKPPFPLGNAKAVIGYIKNNPSKVLNQQQCDQIAYQVEQKARLKNYNKGGKD